VKVVQQILDRNLMISYVLDPFSGTGTTGLVCGEKGIRCDLFDINPFLVWFAAVKIADYSAEHIHEAQLAVQEIISAPEGKTSYWAPPISNISRWWSATTLSSLAAIRHQIMQRSPNDTPARDLLLIAFCRLLIETSNAAFNHQSMSFKNGKISESYLGERGLVVGRFGEIADEILASARTPVSGDVHVAKVDARCIPNNEFYDCVITSPPYPNRMSYIRELRPYMYWLEYLKNAREAGELDWSAIGGTWGIATSRLKDWQPGEIIIHYPDFRTLINRIAESSLLLANYVHKYFVDIRQHLRSLYPAVKPGGRVFYIVGNSKFYDTLVPTEQVYAYLLKEAGFCDVRVDMLRKRNSKKELFEYLVSAQKPL